MSRWLWLYGGLIVTIGTVIVVQNVWCLNKQDWASWAQAVGSVAAVACALWIALREDRRRARESLSVARVTAAGLSRKLTVMITAFEAAREFFEPCSKADGDPRKFAIWHGRLAEISPIPKEDQIALIALSERCAFRIAGVNDRLHVINEMLASLRGGNKINDSDARKECATWVTQFLSESIEALSMAWHECDAATKVVETS